LLVCNVQTIAGLQVKGTATPNGAAGWLAAGWLAAAVQGAG
jgi:hypothetical protein